jgi:serine/threonine-protein kinase
VSAARPGDVVAGKYKVERVLGEGGMGYVVAARHLALGQMVALKFMRDEVVTPQYRSRFIREGRHTVKLKSKHVSRVSDVGETEGGTPYMVMEYLEGTDLSDLLHERMKDGRGPLPVAEACEYLIQACEAIAEAHSHGIVHRDLKPANLFLTKGTGGEPIVKVLDFGVSKVLELGMEADDTSPGGRPRAQIGRGRGHNPDSAVTKATDLLGSPSYMAPEQVVSARDADIQSDIWSLGVILFRLISGRAPFGGQSLGELIQAIMNGPIPNLREAKPDIPPGLEQVVGRCLEREKSRRLSDVTELARMLAPYAAPVATPSLERIALLGPALVTVPAPTPSGPSATGGSVWTRGQVPTHSTRATKKDMSSASAVIFGGLFVVVLICGVTAIALKYTSTGATPRVEPRPEVPVDPLPPTVALPPPDPTPSIAAPPVTITGTTAQPAPPKPAGPGPRIRPRAPTAGAGGPARPPSGDIPTTRE